MDTIRKKQKTFPVRALAFGGLLLLALLGYWLLSGRTGGNRSVAINQLSIGTVAEEVFYEYVNLNGQISPRKRQRLDCKMAGTVESVFAESGDQVKKGDTLLRLSNAELELQVMQRESELIEQLNGQRQTALLLNQNDFNRRAEIIENNYQLALEQKRFDRADTLLGGGVIALADYEPTAARMDYYVAQRNLLSEAYRQDSMARSVQLRQIAAAETRLLTNLDAIRALLDRLWVIAPTTGKLDQFSVVAGQTLQAGDQLGELYQLSDPFIEAEVDEFFLNRVEVGQLGLLPIRGDSLTVMVEKIFPSIEGGRFQIRLRLAEDGPLPVSFIKGQSVRFRLLFGTAERSVLLPNGNFFNSSGGSWVYVVEEDQASRRAVTLGRRNPEYYEVLSGLQPGEKVITSDYENFKTHHNIVLTR